MLQRRIYLLPGFDPAALTQSAVLNDQLQRQGLGCACARNRALFIAVGTCSTKQGQPQGIEVVLLQWDDLVRQFWPRHGITLLWSGFCSTRATSSAAPCWCISAAAHAPPHLPLALDLLLGLGIAVALVPLALVALAWPGGDRADQRTRSSGVVLACSR